MKAQLLIILAVLLTSLLTVSQRANAKEVSQLRWLEPSIEQAFSEINIADQEVSSDKDVHQNPAYSVPTITQTSTIYERGSHVTPNPYLTLTEARAPPHHSLI